MAECVVESDVLVGFRAGDEEAVAAVYDRYSGAVFSLSLRILGDRGLAADATQQTFVKAWRAAETFDPKRDFAPWIYSIARRTAIDVYRKERRATPTELDEVPIDGPSFEATWEAFEVRAAVDQLHDDEREIVYLSHFAGLTQTEIAKKLDIPVGTVKSRSHRAHKSLLEKLSHFGDRS